MASSCPSSKSVAGNLRLIERPIAVVDTAGDHGYIPPDPFGRKYLPVLRIAAAAVDTAGDHGHIPPSSFGRKYLPVPRILISAIDTAGDHGHIPPDIFGRKRTIKA